MESEARRSRVRILRRGHGAAAARRARRAGGRLPGPVAARLASGARHRTAAAAAAFSSVRVHLLPSLPPAGAQLSGRLSLRPRRLSPPAWQLEPPERLPPRVTVPGPPAAGPRLAAAAAAEAAAVGSGSSQATPARREALPESD